MKKDCLDIGTIQAFLDGELASDLLETAANHLAVCNDCAWHLATAEEESAIAFSALDAEINTLVPTQRLWAKINDSIEKEKKPFWQVAWNFLKNPAIASFATLLIAFGIFMAYLNSQAGENQTSIAAVIEKTSPVITPISKINPDESNVASADRDYQKDDNKLTPIKPKTEFRVVKTSFVEKETFRKPVAKITRDEVKPQPVVYQYLPGEESYIRTISTLEKTVNSTKGEVLNNSARFTFEKNLAVVNDAITKMRAEVKKNPRNESAKQVLMSSYQNKVDLLNSVAEKTELMASMRLR